VAIAKAITKAGQIGLRFNPPAPANGDIWSNNINNRSIHETPHIYGVVVPKITHDYLYQCGQYCTSNQWYRLPKTLQKEQL
jgi:hypothetical protein